MPQDGAHRLFGSHGIAPLDRIYDIDMGFDIGTQRTRGEARKSEVPEPRRILVQGRYLLFDELVSRGNRQRTMEYLIHSHQPTKVAPVDCCFVSEKRCAERRNVLRRGTFGRQRGARSFQNNARFENVVQLVQAQVRNAGADPRMTLDQPLERKPVQRIAHDGQPDPELPGQCLLVDRGTGGQISEDDAGEDQVVGAFPPVPGPILPLLAISHAKSRTDAAYRHFSLRRKPEICSMGRQDKYRGTSNGRR